MDIQHPISADKQGNIIRGDIQDFKISTDDVQKRLSSYATHLQESSKGLPDELGLTKIAQKLAEQYRAQTTPKQMQFAEKTKSKDLEQLYNKEIKEPAEKTKVSLEKKIPQHESRYETLWNKRYHLSKSEEAEFSHLSANRPLESLSDEANKALAKSLEGKSDEEKGQIKAIISLELTTSIHMDKGGNIVHGARDFSQQSKNEVTTKIQKFIDNFYKSGGTDTIGTIDVLKDFLSLYEQSNKVQQSQNATLENLLQNQNVNISRSK
jgi:hypothetical protein